MAGQTAATTRPGITALTSEVDRLLAAQIVVAWAGEGHVGEERRLGWWRCDLVSEYGGLDLFQRLLPTTAPWAVLQAVREAARRVDAAERALVNNPDGVCSLYRLGFEIDERAEERLRELKRSGEPPQTALPGLGIIYQAWSRSDFAAWVDTHGKANHVVEPIGRRLTGERPATLDVLVTRLVAGLAGLPEKYPLPHYRGAK
ncbi:MAG: BREX-6 system BrxE protein [Gemmatimonadetes bacterium]|jgi:hypothetical protein|nr:BREX-6 system BrxE protein [Gemmatimonadota bacterium]